MVSRREFLRTGAVAATASVAVPMAIAAEAALPPSIASLKSMKEQARPITTDERRERLERARALMRQNKLDAIMMIGGTSLVYFSGIRWWNSERLGALLLTADGKDFFVSPAFEEGRMREQIARGPIPEAAVLTWQEDESPYKVVAQGLKERGVATGRVGMEETVHQVFVEGIAKAAPSLEMTSATPVTAGCRMVKSAHELELMRLANQVTLKAYEAAWRALKDGMTDKDAANLIRQAHEKLGFEGDAMVLVGEYAALPHGTIQPQTLRENSLVLIDGGGSVEGYSSDISRTFVLGKPSDKMKRVFEIVQRAQKTALAAARPGVEAQAVDAAARKVISDAGFGPDYKHFTHRVGHGIGMDVHEWTYLVRGNTLALAPGMTFSDEPGIYIRGEFGVRLEDIMHITEDGAQLFTPASTSLEKPFA